LTAESRSATYGKGQALAGMRTTIGTALVAFALFGAGCANLPPGMDGPKPASTSLEDPGKTTLGKRLAAAEKANPGKSGFRLLVDGTDTFALHLEIAEKAERTLDVQYFLLVQDDTGKLLLESLLRAADRGVRVRLLLDDAEAFEVNSKIRPLAAHPNVDIRIFNPFIVRREMTFLRWAEFVVGSRRLNYRMHNKLFIGDNAIALTGGRNVGDSYYQASSKVELGDFDLAVAGPMVRVLSHSFDLYWNDRLAIPVTKLSNAPSPEELDRNRKALVEHREKMANSEYIRSLPKGNLLDQMLSGKAPLVWAYASLAYDLPDKAKTASDDPGRLMWERVAAAVEETQRELIVATPYLVPGESEMALIRRLRERGVRVRILTNSLASTDMPIVHIGYEKYRAPLLEAGCELYEVRPMLGKPRDGRGGSIKSGSSEHFALHAKVFVIDRRRAFVGSMNFDQRSLDINTEIGIIIDSPKIANDIAARFEAIVEPANSYRLALEGASVAGPSIQWITEMDGKPMRFDTDPDVDAGKRTLIRMLSLLPLDSML